MLKKLFKKILKKNGTTSKIKYKKKLAASALPEKTDFDKNISPIAKKLIKDEFPNQTRNFSKNIGNLSKSFDNIISLNNLNKSQIEQLVEETIENLIKEKNIVDVDPNFLLYTDLKHIDNKTNGYLTKNIYAQIKKAIESGAINLSYSLFMMCNVLNLEKKHNFNKNLCGLTLIEEVFSNKKFIANLKLRKHFLKVKNQDSIDYVSDFFFQIFQEKRRVENRDNKKENFNEINNQIINYLKKEKNNENYKKFILMLNKMIRKKNINFILFE